MTTEQWNIPGDYAALIVAGECQYSILGVETHNNSDSMNRFVEAVPGLADKIEVDDGTQIIVTHPDPAKMVTIDAHGLGDFFDSGFDVTIQDRAITQTPAPVAVATREVEVWGNKVVVTENGDEIGIFPETAHVDAAGALANAALFVAGGDMLAALTALLAILGGDRSALPECDAARAAIARVRGEV